MTAIQVEAWALNVIERVERGEPVEDSRVKLKTDWIGPEDAARRIAGHANAARGAEVLWLIGVDERNRKVVGADCNELANWWPQVQAEFDRLAPSMVDYNVPHQDKTVVALVFETDRAPFVVKNQAYRKPEGGPVQWEVPWREGTAVRSASREDLVKLLSPMQALPTLEVVEGTLSVTKEKSEKGETLSWNLWLRVYVEPGSQDPLVIPYRRCRAVFCVPGCLGTTAFRYVALHALLGYPQRAPNLIRVAGPDSIDLRAEASTDQLEEKFGDEAHVTGSLRPAKADVGAPLEASLRRCKREGSELFRWCFRADQGDAGPE